MKIIEKEKFNILVPEKDNVLIEKEKQNEETFKEAYLPKSITLEECKQKFIEIVEGDEN